MNLKIKTGYYFELVTPETMKLLGSTQNKITVKNDCQQDSRILYIFVLNKTFGSLSEISPTNFIFLKTWNSEFQAIGV